MQYSTNPPKLRLTAMGKRGTIKGLETKKGHPMNVLSPDVNKNLF
jgi:hypothetical protein